MSNDEETNKELAQANALSGMFKSSGWKVAEESLNEIIAELRDARNIDISREDASKQIEVNLAVAENLEVWVDDLKGRVDNAIIMEEQRDQSNLVTRR